MTDDERFLYDHIIKGYQQELANIQFLLLREQAQSAQKDSRIAALEAAVPPKPGPPRSR